MPIKTGYELFIGKLQGLRLLADVIKEELKGDEILCDFAQVLGDICAELRDTYPSTRQADNS